MTSYWGRLGGRLIMTIAVLCFSATAALAQMTPDAEFIRAIRKQDYNKVLPYLVNGGNPNAREYDSTPALVVAVEIGDQGLVRSLLEYKANPDLFNRSTGETPLMRAATQGDLQSSQLLVYYKADLDAPDKQGETALIKAVRSKSEEIVSLLMQAGADVDLADYTGMTPMDHAKRIGNPRIVRLLEMKPAPAAPVAPAVAPAIKPPSETMPSTTPQQPAMPPTK